MRPEALCSGVAVCLRWIYHRFTQLSERAGILPEHIGLTAAEIAIGTGMQAQRNIFIDQQFSSDRVVFIRKDVDHGDLITALELGAQIAVRLCGPGRINVPDEGVGHSGVRGRHGSGLLGFGHGRHGPTAQETGILEGDIYSFHAFAKGDQYPQGVIGHHGSSGVQDYLSGFFEQSLVRRHQIQFQSRAEANGQQ